MWPQRKVQAGAFGQQIVPATDRHARRAMENDDPDAAEHRQMRNMRCTPVHVADTILMA